MMIGRWFAAAPRVATVALLCVFAIGIVSGLSAHAQQTAVRYRIGFLGPSGTPQLGVFRENLAALGYIEGQNVTIESLWPEEGRLDRLPQTAASLVNLKPDVIVAVGATAARAAKGATADIPIVFEIVIDPVADALVSNLVRPGGNLTGFTSFDPQQATKQIDILREAIPALTRVALLGDAGAAPTLFQANEEAARAAGLQAIILKVDRVPNPNFESAFEAAKKEGAGAMIVISTPVTALHRKQITELAAKHRLPLMSPRDHADAGGLISYGTSFSETTRRTSAYVDRILKGTKPGDLPIEAVTNQELVINLRAARELGITLPSALLGRSNQLIQ